MKQISLTQNKFALVNDKDFRQLSKWKWHFYHGGYAVRSTFVKGKRGQILMHREIMNCPKGMEVDHINHNKLDNRRENLRIISHQQNIQFREKQINNKSGFIGVTWHKKAKKFQSAIQFNNKMIYLGLFVNPKDAAIMRDIKAKELFGKFARLNFPIANSSA